MREAEPKPGVSYRIFDTDVRGFSAIIYPSGNRAFTLDYLDVGRHRPMTVEPRVGTVTANYKQRCLSTCNVGECGEVASCPSVLRVRAECVAECVRRSSVPGSRRTTAAGIVATVCSEP